MKIELSACVIEKFNGYEFLRSHLQSKEKIFFIPIDIVYEPTFMMKNPSNIFLRLKFLSDFIQVSKKQEKEK